jgi:hypothetical protein
MESQNTPNTQSNLEKKRAKFKASQNLILKHTIKTHSHIFRQRILNKDAKIFINWIKEASSTNAAVKNGYSHVED